MLKKIVVCFALAVWLVLLVLVFVWLLWQDYSYTRQTVDSIRPADKAVILSTKAYENGHLNPCLVARVQAGVELYQAGKVKALVMSGGINRDHQYGSRNMQAIAEKMGVPSSAILQEDQSANTFENIVFSRSKIEDSQNVVIVSAGFHLPRAHWMAEKQWSQNIQLYAAPHCTEPHGGYAYSLTREIAAIVKNGLKGHY